MNLRFWRPLTGFLIAISIVAFILYVVVFYVLNSGDAPSYEKGQRRADPLIIALEVYRQGWGKHPTELQALVPDFLPKIPKAGWRYPFYYNVCEEGVGYILYFKSRGEIYCGFSSVNVDWTCGGDDSALPRSFYSPCASKDK